MAGFRIYDICMAGSVSVNKGEADSPRPGMSCFTITITIIPTLTLTLTRYDLMAKLHEHIYGRGKIDMVMIPVTIKA